MNRIIVPALCKRCGKTFLVAPFPMELVEDRSPISIREQIFPRNCPNKECRGDVIVPAGKYEWVGKQVRLIEGSDFTHRIFKQANEVQKESLILFRYMNHKFVEKFRNEGILRICPLTKYQSIQDMRQDDLEGIQITKFKGSGLLTGVQAKSILGVDVHSLSFEPGWNETTKFSQALPLAYVMSVSTTRSIDLMKRFKCDDYFVISNVVVFNQALERAISAQIEVKYAIDNHVEYEIEKVRQIIIEKLIKTNSTVSQFDIMSYFRKTKDYIEESEYRFVYGVESGNPLEELYVKLTPEEIRASCQFRAEYEFFSSNYPKVNPNDQCPCGSTKKYKRCHGKR
ncbi:MAG TPA: hypothetical protein DCR40_18730 [Prolixibacteraceae bacterium]|nr:hypothetical protein [Prolixibacteraceae bacterium]